MVTASSPTWETLEAFARQSMQQFLQRTLEAEVDELLARGRYERRAAVGTVDRAPQDGVARRVRGVEDARGRGARRRLSLGGRCVRESGPREREGGDPRRAGRAPRRPEGDSRRRERLSRVDGELE